MRFVSFAGKRLVTILAKIPGVDVCFSEQIPDYLPIYEKKWGHERSRHLRRPVDGNGDPLPWFTYPAIEYIQQLDLSDLVVFEWGSGNSSLFFADRVKQITSVESDRDWFETISKKKKDNQTLVYVEEGDSYPAYISKTKDLYDIIIIDGKLRASCAEEAIKHIKPDGLIILDNSDRHPDISSRLREKDLIQVDMHGLGPVNNYTWTTTFFFRRSYRFRAKNIQPVIPLGGGF